MINASRLRCEYLKNPMEIDFQKPVLFWNVEDAIKQTAYEIKTLLNGKEDWKSGIIKSSSMHCRFNGKVTTIPGGTLEFAKASYRSVYGTETSGWSKNVEGITFNITVPANCSATIVLPDGREEEVAAGRYSYLIK